MATGPSDGSHVFLGVSSMFSMSLRESHLGVTPYCFQYDNFRDPD